jgi:aryl-alcohol dehydrogenase-like predicted oxidoreductase
LKRAATTASIGLGCVTFGREIDKQNSFKILDHAIQKGITMLDTAAAYGGGNSELIVGEWLNKSQTDRDKITLATKIIPPYNQNLIVDSIDQSLNRLQTEKIDILYYHSWDPSCDTNTTLETFEKLIREGKVSELGVSNFSAQQLLSILKRQLSLGFSPVRYIQNNNNFAVRDITAELIEICRQHKISIITYSPLAAGFLTGKYEDVIPAGTRFDIIPGHQQLYFNKISVDRLHRLQHMAQRTGYSVIQLALAWALQQPEVSTVLAGGRTIPHLDQIFEAKEFKDAEVLLELSKF